MVRVKRRYILFKFVSKQDKKQDTRQDKFLDELRNKLANVFGDFGVACLNRGFTIKKQDPKDGVMILQVRRDVSEMVMAVLPLCDVTILHLSGTMRSCLRHMKENYIMSLRAAIAIKQNNQQKSNKNKNDIVEMLIDS